MARTAASQHFIIIITLCPRSFDPFYIVTYYYKNYNAYFDFVWLVMQTKLAINKKNFESIKKSFLEDKAC